MVAGGHLTDTPLDSVYSGVVSLRSVRMTTFLAEHNEMDRWATGIGNAYLEAYTSEKVCIITRAEFGELAGRLLMIAKALYGLNKSSGLHSQSAYRLYYMIWGSILATVIRVYGCEIREITMNILLFMSTIWKLLRVCQMQLSRTFSLSTSSS